MIFANIFFMGVEILVYKSLWLLLWEGLYAWAAYYCYVTLSNFALYAYMALIAYAGISGIFFILSAFSSGFFGLIFFAA